jgi:hypothetical protein
MKDVLGIVFCLLLPLLVAILGMTIGILTSY